MKKVIFEGTVNGTTYDNVEDYNAAVKEALRSGNVEASSQTRQVDTEDEDLQDSNVELGVDLFPGFEHCEDIDSLDSAFISSALGIGLDQFKEKASHLVEDVLKEHVEKLTNAEMTLYKEYIQKIRKHLNEIARDYKGMAEQYSHHLEDLLEELEELEEATKHASDEASVVNTTAKIYEDLERIVDERLNSCTQSLSAGCEYKKPEQSKPEQPTQAPSDYANNIIKLCKMIFGE